MNSNLSLMDKKILKAWATLSSEEQAEMRDIFEFERIYRDTKRNSKEFVKYLDEHSLLFGGLFNKRVYD